MTDLSIAISAFGVAACAALVAYVLVRLPRDGRTDALALLIGGFVLVHLQELLYKLPVDETVLLSTGLVLHVSHSLANVGALLFALHLTGRSRLARSRAVSFTLWGWLVFTGVLQSPTVSGMRYVPTDGVWVAHYSDLVRRIVILVNVGISAVALLLLASELRVRWADPIRRAQLRLLLVGGAVTLGFGLFTDILLPVLGFVEQPRLLGIGFLGFLGVTVYAVQRYELLRFSMEAAARVALDRITDAVLVLDRQRHLLYTNPIGEESIDADLLQRLPEDPWRLALEGATSTGLRMERSSRVYDLALVPLETEGKRVVVAIFHDNTEVEQARAAAIAANQAKSQFLANMSHELRTPLNAVIGYAEMLAEEAPELTDDLHRIETSGRYLLTLINDILDLSKVTSGKLEVRPQDVFLAPLVEEAVREVRPLAARHGAAIELDELPSVPILADPTRVKQILLNLLSNAAKFSEGHPIRIEVEVAERVSVAVVDRGVGMDEEQQSRLFNAFQQVHREGHERYGGTGLGLALSRELARAMAGDIQVRSAPGVGSTFTLVVPRGATSSTGAPPDA